MQVDISVFTEPKSVLFGRDEPTLRKHSEQSEGSRRRCANRRIGIGAAIILFNLRSNLD